MSILCWNYRGFGNRPTVHELGDLIQAQDPLVVFLAKTWLVEARLGDIRDRLGIGNYFGVSKVNLGGGLALFWKKGLEVDVEFSSLNHIDVLINKRKEDGWRFTGFYDEPLTQRMMESWKLLRNLHGKFLVPWLCAGDFNEITKSHEKSGGRLRPFMQIKNFRDVLDECGLVDLGFMGSKFTWFKNIANGILVWERLDRDVGNSDWLEIYPATRVVTLECGTSDHKPIVIHPCKVPVRQKKPWRFEKMWLEEEGCHDMVASA